MCILRLLIYLFQFSRHIIPKMILQNVDESVSDLHSFASLFGVYGFITRDCNARMLLFSRTFEFGGKV